MRQPHWSESCCLPDPRYRFGRGARRLSLSDHRSKRLPQRDVASIHDHVHARPISDVRLRDPRSGSCSRAVGWLPGCGPAVSRCRARRRPSRGRWRRPTRWRPRPPAPASGDQPASCRWPGALLDSPGRSSRIVGSSSCSWKGTWMPLRCRARRSWRTNSPSPATTWALLAGQRRQDPARCRAAGSARLAGSVSSDASKGRTGSPARRRPATPPRVRP